MTKPRRSGLGKGLDSLIPEIINTSNGNNTEDQKAITAIKIGKIEPNRNQPRKEFNQEALEELAESIRLYGIIQPLLVQKKEDYYEIIAGERRWRAAKIAGLKEVPVVVKDYSNQEVVEISLIENIQREDLNPIEEALAYKRLIDEFNLKQEEIATRVSKSRTAITNTMRLLKLTDTVKQMIIEEVITSGHARALLAIEDPDLQNSLAKKISQNNLSVRETEKLIKNILTSKKVKPSDVKEDGFIYKDLEKRIENVMGTKVKLNSNTKGKGKIEIEFYSDEELERIFDLLLTISN